MVVDVNNVIHVFQIYVIVLRIIEFANIDPLEKSVFAAGEQFNF